MKRSLVHSRIWPTLICVSLILIRATAWASLGDSERSIEVDRTLLKARLNGPASAPSNSGNSLFRIHTLVDPHGVLIREFVSNDGKVFAVCWNGATEPDLSVLLGTHFIHYQAAIAAPEKRVYRRGSIRITAQDLVLEKGGHMRALRGRAYVPGLLPAGLNLREVQ